jgi:glucose-1-phosphate thymidylyltransferase
MRAVIPVAGFGSRLRPHTHSLPKVLLNVAGRPILAHILDELINQKIDKVTIITGYKGDMIKNYVTSHYDFDAEFVVQDELLGLGHAIWTAAPTFSDEEVMIVLGDTIFDADLSKAYRNNQSSIGVKYVDDPRRFGVVTLDKENNVTKFIEKPKTLVSNLAIVGIYYIKNGLLLADSLNELIKNNIKTRDEYQLTDALELMLQKGEKFQTFEVDGWHDCGKKETMLATNQFLLEKYNKSYKLESSIVISPSFIGDNVEISNSVIGPYASVANGSKISNSIIKDSIISENASVSNISIDKSIIGNNSIVDGKLMELNLGSNSELSI